MAEKLALVMVGLPARGKTYTARKIARYLSWLGHAARVFNVGSYRRERVGSGQPHGFFDPENLEGAGTRRELAVAALDDMLAWLDGGGEIAIYDATNSTRERRSFLREACARHDAQVIFVESICDDDAIVDVNVRETKARSPDYAGLDPADAVSDFRARIAHYAKRYETVAEDEGSFVKVIDVGRKVVVNDVRGETPARVVFFLLNLHIQPRSFWLTRHGESLFNVDGRIGGDAGLSARGIAYADALAHFVDATIVKDARPLLVWTSTLARTVQTAARLGRPSRAFRALDEIDAGVCDGMTYAEIAQRLPVEQAARQADKLKYRYPRGESYEDVIQRLEPVILELERERRPLLVIAHQAVLRALYAYLMDLPPSSCPTIDVPLHTVLELTPTAYGCDERRWELGPAPMDRHASSAA